MFVMMSVFCADVSSPRWSAAASAGTAYGPALRNWSTAYCCSAAERVRAMTNVRSRSGSRTCRNTASLSFLSSGSASARVSG